MEQKDFVELLKKAIAFGYEQGITDTEDGRWVELNKTAEEILILNPQLKSGNKL